MAARIMEDANWAFAAYEAVRERLPTANFPKEAQPVEHLGDLVDQFDVFLLDAFGVLNIGEVAIPGAPERIAMLRATGKIVMVLSNAAGYPKRLLMDKYTGLGYLFEPSEVITSREVLLAYLAQRPSKRRGLMASQIFGLEELEHLNGEFLADDPSTYDEADEFLLIGAAEWTEERQQLLKTSLRANPRSVLVGNPDIVAPRETGLSQEPGHFAHRLADKTDVAPVFFGKPFANAFETALAGLPDSIDPSRVVMVGDTLHTDILGGAAAGVKTALITGFGSLTGIDANLAIERSGIIPDYIMPRP